MSWTSTAPTPISTASSASTAPAAPVSVAFTPDNNAPAAQATAATMSTTPAAPVSVALTPDNTTPGAQSTAATASNVTPSTVDVSNVTGTVTVQLVKSDKSKITLPLGTPGVLTVGSDESLSFDPGLVGDFNGGGLS